MFVLIVRYVAPLADIEQLLPEHVAYLERHYVDGTFLLSGRQVPRTGGLILARGDDRGRIEQLVSADPFVVAGAAHYEIIQVAPTKAVPDWAWLLA
jgi:uncharacterized protein YciI